MAVSSIQKKCPYKSLGAPAYWRQSVAEMPSSSVDPFLNAKFKIDTSDKVATAGSCFAQHISRYLNKIGDNYFVVEQGSQILSESVKRNYNYGTFSCRYGNIYTTRQLNQMFDRAFGHFIPHEQPWECSGYFVDPFRPAIQPKGFASIVELETDRQIHLKFVRKMFEEMDVFVFTLGLTECWVSCADGAVLPVCPGCGSGGEFSEQQYKFVNESVFDVIQNLESFICKLKSVNQKCKVLLTVSPVPLIATYSKQSALSANTYSKSVLRAAVGEIYKKFDNVDYFPSYEIITGIFNRGSYFEEDCRSVTAAGVHHVMKLIMSHYFGVVLEGNKDNTVHEVKKTLNSERVSKLVCDEELLLSEVS